nr:hypothetical protein [uncultured Christensenella sp.]
MNIQYKIVAPKRDSEGNRVSPILTPDIHVSTNDMSEFAMIGTNPPMTPQNRRLLIVPIKANAYAVLAKNITTIVMR